MYGLRRENAVRMLDSLLISYYDENDVVLFTVRCKSCFIDF